MYAPILAQVATLKELDVSAIFDQAFQAQKSLCQSLEQHDLPQPFRNGLAQLSAVLNSVTKENLTPTCRPPLLMYVSICRALKEELQLPERQTPRLATYQYLLLLWGKATLAVGCLLNDDDRSVELALRRFSLELGSLYGLSEPVILRAGQEKLI